MKKHALYIGLFIFFSIAHKGFTQSWQELDSLGVACYQKRQYQKADSIFTIALSLLEKQIGKKDSLYAGLLSYRFACNYFSGQYEKAASLGEEQLALTRLLKGNEHIDCATSCNNLGSLYRAMGRYDKTEQLYLEAKDIRAKVLGKESPLYAACCNNLALLYTDLGFYEKAEPLYHESGAIQEKTLGKEHTEYGTNRNNLATLYMNMGQYERAEPLFVQAKDIREKALGKTHPDYAYSCNNLAALYAAMWQFDKAEPLYLEAKMIREKVLGKLHPYYAASCNSLASLYQEMGLYSKAEPLHIEAMAVREKSLGKEHPDYATSCNNLATLYSALDEHQKAEPLYKEAKSILQKVLGSQHPDYAQSCNNLAGLYLDLRQHEKAEPLYLEAKEIREKVLGKEHPDYAQSCNNLASLYKELGQIDKAESLYLEAKSISEKVLGKRHLYYAAGCKNLAKLYEDLELYVKAEPLLMEATHIKRAELSLLFPLFSEKERSDYLKSTKVFYEHFYSFAASYQAQKPSIASALMDQTLFIKAAIFSSTQKMRNQIHHSNDTSLVNGYERWRTVKEKLNQLSNLSDTERERSGANLQKLEEEVNEMEKELSKKSSHFAKQAQVPAYNWQDLKNSLGKGEVAVELIRVMLADGANGTIAPSYIALFVSEKTDNYPEMILIKNGRDLETKLLNYYRMCLNLKKEDKSSYKAFWEPIAEKLQQMSPKGFSKIYFSPDGVYHQISLNGLLNTESGKYLSEQYTLQVLGTCRDIIENKGKQEQTLYKLKTNREIHLFGYPAYGSESKLNTEGSSRERGYSGVQDALGTQITWTNLPGTKKEVEEVGSTLRSSGMKAIVHEAKEATEDAIKALRDPLVLHIATHGYFVQGYSGKNESIQDYMRMKTMEDPFQRCGLALAGCSDPKPGLEDGILTASEAMNLHLDNTELVVLSACETGLGDIVNGEGVFGLQRAFQQAGAKTVLMSLWKVNDEATQLLMTEFYKQLAKGKSKREAFVSAQNSLRKQFPHPYYWAAFVMIGE